MPIIKIETDHAICHCCYNGPFRHVERHDRLQVDLRSPHLDTIRHGPVPIFETFPELIIKTVGIVFSILAYPDIIASFCIRPQLEHLVPRRFVPAAKIEYITIALSPVIVIPSFVTAVSVLKETVLIIKCLLSAETERITAVLHVFFQLDQTVPELLYPLVLIIQLFLQIPVSVFSACCSRRRILFFN